MDHALHDDPDYPFFEGFMDVLATYFKKLPNLEGGGYTQYYFFEFYKGNVYIRKTVNDPVFYTHTFVAEDQLDIVRTAIMEGIFRPGTEHTLQSAKISDVILPKQPLRGMNDKQLASLAEKYFSIPPEFRYYYPEVDEEVVVADDAATQKNPVGRPKNASATADQAKGVAAATTAKKSIGRPKAKPAPQVVPGGSILRFFSNKIAEPAVSSASTPSSQGLSSLPDPLAGPKTNGAARMSREADAKMRALDKMPLQPPVAGSRAKGGSSLLNSGPVPVPKAVLPPNSGPVPVPKAVLPPSVASAKKNAFPDCEVTVGWLTVWLEPGLVDEKLILASLHSFEAFKTALRTCRSINASLSAPMSKNSYSNIRPDGWCFYSLWVCMNLVRQGREARKLCYENPEDVALLEETMEFVLGLMSTAKRVECEPRLRHACAVAQDYVENDRHLSKKFWGGSSDEDLPVPGVYLVLWLTAHGKGSDAPARLSSINDGVHGKRYVNNVRLDAFENILADGRPVVHGIFCGDHYYLPRDESGRLINDGLPGLFDSALHEIYDKLVVTNLA
jgi:hypothetical protein